MEGSADPSERSAAGVLDELSVVAAELRRLERRRGDLMRAAQELGVIQEEIARRLEVSQAAVSRQLRSRPATLAEARERLIEDAIDAYEAGRSSEAELLEQLLAVGDGPMPAFERGVIRGTIGLDVARRVREARSPAATERERLVGMDPDLLADLLRVTVHDTLARLRRQGDTTGLREDLARRARASRAADPTTRADLILQCRAILDEGPGANLGG